MSENTAKTTEQLLADEKIRVEEWQEYGLKEGNRRVKAERELATERAAKEQDEQLLRWQSESLESFRRKLNANSNCRALDAVDQLKAEVERLRAALDFITRCKEPIESTGYMMQEKAREALGITK